jgi:hypothetical protein
MGLKVFKDKPDSCRNEGLVRGCLELFFLINFGGAYTIFNFKS